MRRLTVAASSLVLAGCIAGQPVQPQQGPMLVIDVMNASAAEATLEHEFESEGMSGAGESLLPACRRETLQLAPISGSYRMRVERTTVAEGVVPASAGSEQFLVVRLLIGPDGEVEAAAPVVLAEPPNASAAIPGCADE
jgi:hypothetical protein